MLKNGMLSMWPFVLSLYVAEAEQCTIGNMQYASNFLQNFRNLSKSTTVCTELFATSFNEDYSFVICYPMIEDSLSSHTIHVSMLELRHKISI